MTNLQPLWKISEELEILLDTLDVCPDEQRSEIEERIAAYVTAQIDKIDHINGLLNSLDAVSANAKTEIERLRERQQSAERSRQRLESYLIHVLHKRDGKPLRGKNVTFSVRRTEALAIVNPELVPDKYKRTTITVDVPKTPIKEALKAGEVIPGVALQVNEHLVRK
jgi:hypothetical protein